MNEYKPITRPATRAGTVREEDSDSDSEGCGSCPIKTNICNRCGYCAMHELCRPNATLIRDLKVKYPIELVDLCLDILEQLMLDYDIDTVSDCFMETLENVNFEKDIRQKGLNIRLKK
jgi:hypothetical protein